MPLNGHKLRHAVHTGVVIRLRQLPRIAVRDADGADLAGLHRVVQPLHNLLNGRAIIPHVADVQINVVHTETLQACIEAVFHVLLPRHVVCNLLVGARLKFRRQHHVLAAGKIAQHTADKHLARAALVAHRRVKKVDAVLERRFDDLVGAFLIQRPAVLPRGRFAKAHAAKANARNIQVRVAEFYVFHVSSPFL